MACVTSDGHPVIALVDHRELTRTALLRSFGEAVPGAIMIGVARVSDLAGHAGKGLRLVILYLDHTEIAGGTPIDVVTAARSFLAGVPFVTLSEGLDDESLRAAIEGGASAHLTTDMPIQVAAATLRLVMLGGTSFPVPAIWVRRWARRPPAAQGDGSRVHCLNERLTQREEEVLKLVGQGAQNKIIAYRLNMSENTVKVHLHRILQKFQLHNRTEVALLAGTYFAGARTPAEIAPDAEPSSPRLDLPRLTQRAS